MSRKIKFITTSALIAAVYAVLTVSLSFISFRQVQFRISEVLTVLPYFTPAAIPGLFVGCILGNLSSPFGPIDIAVGSAATLVAACLSRIMPKKWLVPLPPIVCNAVFVGAELYFIAKIPLLWGMLSVAAGEAVVCYAGGFPLLLLLEKYKKYIFK